MHLEAFVGYSHVCHSVGTRVRRSTGPVTVESFGFDQISLAAVVPVRVELAAVEVED